MTILIRQKLISKSYIQSAASESLVDALTCTFSTNSEGNTPLFLVSVDLLIFFHVQRLTWIFTVKENLSIFRVFLGYWFDDDKISFVERQVYISTEIEIVNDAIETWEPKM